MAQNKLENQISEKLNEREIQPSAMSWDRLDAMLTISEEKKTKHSFFFFKYIGIAASVLAFVSLGWFFFSPKNTHDVIRNKVVITSPQPESLKSSSPKSPSLPIEKYPISEGITSTINTPSNINKQKKSNSIEVSIINPSSKSTSNQSPESSQQEPIDKAHEKIQKKNSMVNAEELLAEVEKEQKADIKLKSSSIKVDPKNLLTEVDKEVNTTFREKVLNTIEKKYKSTKESLANRNKE